MANCIMKSVIKSGVACCSFLGRWGTFCGLLAFFHLKVWWESHLWVYSQHVGLRDESIQYFKREKEKLKKRLLYHETVLPMFFVQVTKPSSGRRNYGCCPLGATEEVKWHYYTATKSAYGGGRVDGWVNRTSDTGDCCSCPVSCRP